MKIRLYKRLFFVLLSFVSIPVGVYFFQNSERVLTAAETTHPGVVEISRPENFDRILAISDVHGMYPELLNLLQKAGLINPSHDWTGGKTLLVVVGDSIDKGAQSVEVIDLWIHLQLQAPTTGGTIIHLLGNHEAEFLSDPRHDTKTAAFINELKLKNIALEQFTDPQYARARFLRSMPLAARIGSWLFCHSGFLPQLSWQDLKTNAASTLNAGNYGDPLLSDEQSILEAKKWETNPEQKNLLLSRLNANGFQGVVFGHQPKALGIKGKCGMSSDGRLIKIDNGMAPEAGSHPGSMLEFLKPKDLNHFKSPKVKAIDARGRSTSLPISDAA